MEGVGQGRCAVRNRVLGYLATHVACLTTKTRHYLVCSPSSLLLCGALMIDQGCFTGSRCLLESGVAAPDDVIPTFWCSNQSTVAFLPSVSKSSPQLTDENGTNYGWKLTKSFITIILHVYIPLPHFKYYSKSPRFKLEASQINTKTNILPLHEVVPCSHHCHSSLVSLSSLCLNTLRSSSHDVRILRQGANIPHKVNSTLHTCILRQHQRYHWWIHMCHSNQFRLIRFIGNLT